MKWFATLALVLVTAACARESKNEQQYAQVPAYGYGATCVQNGGYGCNFGSSYSYPTAWQPYPYSGGYYNGYYGNSYSNWSACGAGYYTFYSPYYGLGCVPLNSYYTSYYTPYYYTYGNYQALYYCTPNTGNSGCPSSTSCVQCGSGYGYCATNY